MIPLGSILVPGLGQYIDGAHRAGAGYTTTAGAGAALALAVGRTDGTDAGLPRDASGQLRFAGLHVLQTAGFLSAWDAFQRAVPALQQEGKYQFLTTKQSLGNLLTAPFDADFLGQPTTWLNLAYTGLVAGLVIAGRDQGDDYETFRPRDVAFVASSSFNAGVGEEAVFRGWLLPILHQNFGRRFWLANAVQAGVFGGLHAARAEEFAAVIGAWALYEGWLTRRNDWSIRESIFHHFWYDVAVVASSFLADEREDRIQVTFPVIRF